MPAERSVAFIAPVFALLALLAAPALAASPGEDAAKRAADTHEAWCSDAATGRATRHADALVELAPVLQEVSSVFEASGEPFLLYWRGLLNRCLSQHTQAQDDLRAFVSYAGASDVYASQVERAVALLRRYAAQEGGARSQPSPVLGGVVVGAGLAVGSAALGGLAGWQGGLATEGQARYDEGQRSWADSQIIADEADVSAGASGGLVAGAVGVGLASAVTFIVTATRGDAPSVVLLPRWERGAVGLVLAGSW